MTITRIWQSGWEINRDNTEADDVTVGNSYRRTGSYGASLYGACYKTAPASYTQCRAGAFFRHASGESGDASVFRLTDNLNAGVKLQWDATNEEFDLILGATLVTSVGDPTFALPSTWFHLAMDVKIDAVNGWVYFYRDGVNLISYTGPTDQGVSNVNRLYIGAGGWSSNVTNAQDDLYWDDTTGEAAPVPPPALSFYPLVPDGNGGYSQWAGSDANQTDNYLLVDEVTPDLDTTYVYADTANLRDAYAVTSLTLDENAVVEAIIPLAMAKKMAVDGDPLVKTFVRYDGADLDAAAVTLGTDYAVIWARFPTDPSANGWTLTSLAGVELGIATETAP